MYTLLLNASVVDTRKLSQQANHMLNAASSLETAHAGVSYADQRAAAGEPLLA